MTNEPFLANIQATQPVAPELPAAPLEDLAQLGGGAVAVVGEASNMKATPPAP